MTLYLLSNRISGLRYVGATRLLLTTRMSQHRRDAFIRMRTTVICDAIRTHGWESFDVAVLGHTDDFTELMRMERETIAALGTMTPRGYNMSSGGLGVPNVRPSETSKAKIGKSRLGVAPWNKGKKAGPLSPETKSKLSVANTGRPAWNKGLKATPAFRQRLRESHVGVNHWNAKQVCYQGKTFSSIEHAAIEVGLSRVQMRYQLRIGNAHFAVQ